MKETTRAAIFVAALASLTLAAAPVQAQEQAPIAIALPPAPPLPKNFLGVSIMGVAGFFRLNIGSFEVYYERVLARHHGLRLAGDFVHVHHNSEGTQAHQWTFGGSLGYRYYLREGHGAFPGLKLAYRRGFGHFGEHAGPGHTHLNNEQILALAQGGYRFLIPRAHLSVVTAIGIGYAKTSVWATNRDDDVGRLAARTSQDNLATLPVALDLEISLGYAF